MLRRHLLFLALLASELAAPHLQPPRAEDQGKPRRHLGSEGPSCAAAELDEERDELRFWGRRVSLVLAGKAGPRDDAVLQQTDEGLLRRREDPQLRLRP